MMTALLWIVLAAVSGVIGAESVAWCERVQRWIIGQIAIAHPPAERDFQRKVLLGELANINGPITRTVFLLHLLARRRAYARNSASGATPSPLPDLLRAMGTALLLIFVLAGSITLFTTPGSVLIEIGFIGLIVFMVGLAIRIQRVRGGRAVVWLGVALMGIAYGSSVREAYAWWLTAATLVGFAGALCGTFAPRFRRGGALAILALPVVFVGIEVLWNPADMWLALLRALPSPLALLYLGLTVICALAAVRRVLESVGIIEWQDGTVAWSTRRHDIALQVEPVWVIFRGELRRSRK